MKIDRERLARALSEVAFEFNLPPERITDWPQWYDEPGPDEHLVFDSDRWSGDVANAIADAYEDEEDA